MNLMSLKNFWSKKANNLVDKVNQFFDQKLKENSSKYSKYLAAFFLGSIANLAFAPINFFFAIFISIGGFYLLLMKSLSRNFSTKQIFLLGFSFGFGYFFFGVYWIAISLLVDAASFAWLIPLSLSLIPSVLAIYFGLMALVFRLFIKKFSEKFSYAILFFALSWLIFEVLRSYLFSGFPWNLIGYVWLFDEVFAQSASIFGIYGLSFFAVLIAVAPTIFFFRDHQRKIDKKFAIILLILFIANLVFGAVSLQNKPEILPTKFRVVQANIKQEMKWRQDERYRNLLKHIELSTSKSSQDISAVIWSETSVPYPINDNFELLQFLSKAVPENGYLITGGLKVDFTDSSQSEVSKIANSIFLIDKNGVTADYEKSHLVPFGEYIPLKKYLPFVNKITEGAVDFSEGKGNKTIVADKFSFSPLVCYEIIFTNKIIDKTNAPSLLVNLTNDAWFGNSSGPYQHFDMSRMRAIEYGIPLVRAANSGISAFIDGNGRVIEKINLNQEGFFDVNLVEKLAPTIYQKYSYKAYIALVIAIFSLVKVIEFFYDKPKPKKHFSSKNNTY